MKRMLAMLMLALAGSSTVAPALADKWPAKPVRLIVPFPAGGSTDIVARMLGARLADSLGQPFVVDNRGGAGGAIGAELAVRAAPDGYTFILVASSYATTAALQKLPYDPVKDVAAVAMVNTGPLILAVGPGLRVAGTKEFMEQLRARPGALNFGSPGTGSSPHLAGALLQLLSGTRMTHVPYKGDAPAIADLMAGQLHALLLSGPALMPQVKAGRLRALAVTTAERSALMPELPALSEFVPGYAHSAWNGIWAPAGTAREVVVRLNAALANIHRQPDVQERLRADGREPVIGTPEDFGRVIAQDVAKWRKVVAAGNIRVE